MGLEEGKGEKRLIWKEDEEWVARRRGNTRKVGLIFQRESGKEKFDRRGELKGQNCISRKKFDLEGG